MGTKHDMRLHTGRTNIGTHNLIYLWAKKELRKYLKSSFSEQRFKFVFAVIKIY